MQIPVATYRLQFHAGFGFADAAGMIDYLADLGISHIYASPIFEARQGSRHGYDVINPSALNPELGGMPGFQELTRRLHARKMGWLQDIVPNHMAFDYHNRLLMDVFEYGPRSLYYGWFDIDWNHPCRNLSGRLMAPFLDRHYVQCLKDGEIRLNYGAEGFTVSYFDWKFPLRMESYLPLLTFHLERIRSRLGGEHPDYIIYNEILEDLEGLSLPDRLNGRQDEFVQVKRNLFDLYDGNPLIRRCIRETLERFNSGREDSRLLHRLLKQQVYGLRYWKTAAEEINYRRFFDINELICLRQENQAVFDHTHELLGRLVQEKAVSGIRVDHIDGLADPLAYLNRLRAKMGDVYLLVEKILGTGENLPGNWPVQGTTGYEFGNWVNGLFIRTENERLLTRLYVRFSGIADSFDQLVCASKKKGLLSRFEGDLDNLTRKLKFAFSWDRYGMDSTIPRLKQSLAEVISRFPVYRTYIGKENASEQDRTVLQSALSSAVLHRPELRHELMFLERVLMGELDDAVPAGNDESGRRRRQILSGFQQLTAPLAAKGLEDTALYLYNRLISLNEVGGDPGRFGCKPIDFHDFIQKRAKLWPYAMNSTATHDSKRGEDVRARINVLSEIPVEWEKQLEAWHKINRGLKKQINGMAVPEANIEYFLYQTLIGVWPVEDLGLADNIGKRMEDYMVKAVREAKAHTSWVAPDADYEAGLIGFVRKLISPSFENRFMELFLPFCRKVAWFGVFNSLSQCLIKITAPGMPDFYRGTEEFDLTLVDPDNRRPLDYNQLRRHAQKIREKIRSDLPALIRSMMGSPLDGRLKRFLIISALADRSARTRLYREGEYIPLAPEGEHHDHVIAFARRFKNQWSITLVPRFLTGIVEAEEPPLGKEVWEDTAVKLPSGAPAKWENALTGDIYVAPDCLMAGEVFSRFPAALVKGERQL